MSGVPVHGHCFMVGWTPSTTGKYTRAYTITELSLFLARTLYYESFVCADLNTYLICSAKVDDDVLTVLPKMTHHLLLISILVLDFSFSLTSTSRFRRIKMNFKSLISQPLNTFTLALFLF